MKIIFFLSLIFITPVLYGQKLLIYKDPKTNKCGYTDKYGKVVIEAKYNYAKKFINGIAKVNIGGKYLQGTFGDGHWGYIDKTGKEVIPIKYDYVGSYTFGNDFSSYNDFSEEMIPVELSGKWGFVDSLTGKEICPIKYDKVYNFRGGLALAKSGGKVGRIDRMGKEVIPVIYDEINTFDPYKGIAAAKLNGKWGYLTITGKQIVPFIYDKVDPYFIGGKATVQLGGDEFEINMSGERVD